MSPLRTTFSNGKDLNWHRSKLVSMDNRIPHDEDNVDDLSPEWTPQNLADDTVAEEGAFGPVPSLFTSPPPIIDASITATTLERNEVIEQCLPRLNRAHKDFRRLNTHGVPRLERKKHVAFLERSIRDARFVGYDASRPWVVYWSLTGLSILGENVEPYMEK